MATKTLDFAIALKLVEQVSGPLRKMNVNFGTFTGQVNKTRRELSKMRGSARQVDHLAAKTAALNTTTKAMTANENRIGELMRAYREADQAGRSTKRLNTQIEKARKQAKQLGGQKDELRRKIGTLKTELKKSGIQYNSVTDAQRSLSAETDRLNRKLKLQQANANTASKAWARMGNTWRGARRLAGTALIAGSLGTASTVGFAKTAAMFEDFEVTLSVLEGSNAKAAASMAWITHFATRTPFQLEQVTDAFVRLRNFGIEPTGGTLRRLGDTAAATRGKTIIDAVEALGDAVVGENERLKEFGINAQVAGDITQFFYTDRAGTQRAVSAVRNDRKAIQQALEQIMDEKFQNVMARRSETLTGIWSNLMDWWTRFQQMVMGGGGFDRIKGSLSDLLKRIETMNDNGQLQQLAEQTGKKLERFLVLGTEFLQWLWRTGSAVLSVSQQIAGFVGGWENVFYLFLAIKGLGVAVSVAQIATTLTGLGAAAGIAATTIGLVVAAIGLMGAAVYLWITRWEDIKGGFILLVTDIYNWAKSHGQELMFGLPGLLFALLPDQFKQAGADMVAGLWDGIKSRWSGLVNDFKGLISELPAAVKNLLGIQSPSRVFAGFGRNIVEGLGQGILSQESSLISRVATLAESVRAAGTKLAMGAGIAAASSVAAAGQVASSNAGASYHIEVKPTIIVQGDLSPNAAEDLSQRIKDMVEQVIANTQNSPTFFDNA